MPDRHKIWGVAEYVLALIALVGLFLFVHLNMSFELHDPDIWLHLKSGEYIVQHRAIPQVDIFSSTMSNKEWFDHSWLVQVIFYLVFHFGGADNLIFLSAIIVTFAFLFLFLSVYRQRNYLILSIAIFFITILASRIRFNIRPENFSILFFSLYIFILTKLTHKKQVLLLPLIQLIWVNAHGFFILGPLLVGIFILGEKLKRTKLLPWRWTKTDVLDSNSYKNLLQVFLLVCLYSFINPYGYKGVLYPLRVAFASIGKSSIIYNFIDELLPTWRYFNSVYCYYILIIFSFLVFLLNFREINITHLMLWLFFLGISFRINRNILFFNFFAFFTTTNGLIKGLNIRGNNFIDNLLGKAKGLLVYLSKFAIITLLLSWSIKTNYSILSSRYYIYEENRTKSSLLGIAAEAYPEKAADFILKNDLPGNIFNHFNHGSYLIYRLFPKKKVFIDGRTELYGDDFIKNMEKILAVDADTINEVFNRYNVNTVLLSDSGCIFSRLPGYFFNSPEWVLIYLDKDSLIFLRNTAQNKTFINRLKVNLEDYQTPKADIDKIGMEDVFPKPYINRAWIFYYLGLYEQALNEAKEVIRVLPSSSDAYNVIARVYINQKLYDRAFENLRLARVYAPFYRETLISLGDYYTAKGKFDDAVKVYKHLIKLDPYFTEGHYRLGSSFAQQNNTKLAIKSLRTALKLYPFDSRYYKALGELLYKNNDSKGAARVYKSAIDAGLDRTDFHKRLNAISD